MILRIQDATRLPLTQIDKHIHMCDLMYFEGPILSLFRDKKQNWLYLWCDTDASTKERWLLFPVSRADLISYLEKTSSLRTLVTNAKVRWLLDYSHSSHADGDRQQESSRNTYRSLKQVKGVEAILPYLPSDDSFFDEDLAPDVSLTRELNPTQFDVPIDGDWFVHDLDRFSNVYSQLYAFFYCTKPQFITDIGQRVHRFLVSPWKGGYSRINLFEALQRMVPSIHDLKIKEMRYASPGEIKIEALASVGASITEAVTRYLASEKQVSESVRAINILLSSSKLKRADLSSQSDSQLPLIDGDKKVLKEHVQSISDALALQDEVAELSSHAPNMVVSAKVLLALVSRIQRLAEFEHTGLLNLERDLST